MDERVTDTGLLSPGWAGTGADRLTDDEAWTAAMVEVELALARAQAAVGMVPAGVVAALERVHADRRIDPRRLAAGVHATGNPVVAFVAELTAAVADIDPDAAEYVHRGSTSQDVLDSASMVVATRVLSHVVAELDRCATALAGLTQEHLDTPMAGRTLTQHAVPVTFGLRAAGWLALVLDAIDRIERVLDDGLPASLGGAAGTLAAYAEYAERAGVPDAAGQGTELVAPFAAALGLSAPLLPWHSIRTPVADVAAAAVFAVMAVGKFAADVLVLSRTEIGELVEPGEPGRGASSAMPQKRNPVYSTLIATAARQAPALGAVLAGCVVVEDERSAGGWHAEWQPLRDLLRLASGAATNAADLAAGLEVRPERMRANLALTGGAVVSERLGAALAPVVGKVRAKAILAGATAAAERSGRDLLEVLREDPDLAGRIQPGTLEGLLDPVGYTGASARIAALAVGRWRERAAAGTR